MNPRMLQIRTNALVAEYIYGKKLEKLGILSGSISILTIIIPILFTSALLIAKNTPYEETLNTISIAAGAVLLSLSVIELIFHLDQKRESYIIGRRSNIYVANEALKAINEADSNLAWFYNYQVEMDSKDQENIGSISQKLNQEAYRHSLKTLIPGKNDTVCSVCKASPFTYKPGSCQVCGNEPRN